MTCKHGTDYSTATKKLIHTKVRHKLLYCYNKDKETTQVFYCYNHGETI